MAKLINGNGNPAIYAAEDADLIASLAGNVTCIANVGNKYAATEEDATTIRLDDGVIITKEGRRIQLEAGESDTFYIPTGTSGMTNYYIIGYKLVQNADSTQVAEQFVQKMNSSSETITEDTFRGGATKVYVSLYRVTQVNFTITSITGLLPELLDSNSVKNELAGKNGSVKVTANGTETNAQLFARLNALVDWSKVTMNSYMLLNDVGIFRRNNNNKDFYWVNYDSITTIGYAMTKRAKIQFNSNGTITYTDTSADVPSNTTTYELFY
ncbi:MAG: hypothetical protein J6S67_24170 [Methanobrevibacter sp.]|nr:hypothetical protein [Methanobrevibacter sp.]